MSTKKDKFSLKDKLYMQLALDLAKSREGLTGTNPSVGCVIVKGDKILDSKGNITSVLCLIKINCKNNLCSMVNIDDLIITPYHPIKINNKWIFPKDINYPTEYKCNNVYNLVLDNNHTIIINNYISCTLGHNITENEVITHEYFGTEKVINDLNKIEGFDKGYIVLNMDNFIRDHTTGKIIKICT